MDTEKLNKWADLLLDTGKRNNLINFKDYKASTVEVIAPDFFSFFSNIEHNSKFEVYDPKLEDEEEDFDSFDEEDDNQFKEKKISKDNYLFAYGSKLKKQQILLYNDSNKPIHSLKNISKKAKTALEETGVNIAYLAFGFVNWTESQESEVEFRAPILLIPISIENESMIKPYYIRIIDDDIVVNPTFAYKLFNDYGIKLPEFDENISFEEYLANVESIIAKLKWTITRECKLGIFSFLKINMYKDLKDNASKIMENDNVRALLGEANTQLGIGEGEQGSLQKIEELHNVIDADSSQIEAIELAKKGRSFVLQGPPGTGKSQTITNIIAECIYDGKKVLFVSEKLAALNVVYDKLKKVGLEEFCLELHSHKANKKQVIEELYRTIKLPKSGVSYMAERELAAKKDAQRQLDSYEYELHKIRPIINKTLYRLYDEVASCRKVPDVDFVIKDIKNKDEKYIEEAETLLVRYIESVPFIGYDYHQNIWYGYKNVDSSYQKVAELKSNLNNLIYLANELSPLIDSLNKRYEIVIDSLRHAYAFKSFFNIAKNSSFITPELLRSLSIDDILGKVSNMAILSKEILKAKEVLDKSFDVDIYKKIDASMYYKKLTRQFNSFFSRFFNGEYKHLISDIRLYKKDGKKPSYKEALEIMHNLSICQENMQKFNDLENQVKGCFGTSYASINTDFEALLKEIKELNNIKSMIISFRKLLAFTSEEFILEKPYFAQIAEQFNNIFNKYDESVKRLINDFEENAFNIRRVSLKALVNKCEGCLNNIDRINYWCDFLKLLQSLESLELRSFVDDSIYKKMEVNQLVLIYKKAFYAQWIEAILNDSTILLSLTRFYHDKCVNDFKEKDKLNFDINKAMIRAKLSSLRPDLDMVAQGSSVSILLREGGKKRKQKSIRVLFSEIGELVQKIKPCFLMSPLSVSTFLNPNIEFDVVIFDEASQIFPQDALGAIYRGKQLIVVGDSRQMPPSNFFNSIGDINSDDEEEDITDFESILDLCSTSFPQRRLKWHYRSRHEQLISFSNKNFYENELITFPSSKSDKKGIGIDYYYVNGTFDRRSRTNREEAERIVDLVFENIEKYPNRSLGVVAFSIAQQGLIDRLLSKRRQVDPSKEEFFKSDKEEPFFVKNLETVQGDERDTIIFSIAYGKDSQERLLLNFGPINKEGGERRLNVAVTRAKENVQLVTSMHYMDIDLSRTKSTGTRLLREYLDYAENGTMALDRTINVNPFEQYDSEFELEVCDFLKSNGFSVDTQVGCSSYKIDLAVKRPNSSDYVLAIECDGASYHSSKTARDRDRLRQEVLEGMGWRFYRIWSTDWFRNKRTEKDRLLAAVKDALINIPRKVQELNQKTSFEETIFTKTFHFPKYVKADELAISRRYNYRKLSVIIAILEIEAPISEEWLLKRIVFLFDNRTKVTNVVRGEFALLVLEGRYAGIIRQNGFLYLRDKKIPMLRVPSNKESCRDIKYIELRELASGLKEILKQNISAEKMGLFRALSQQLGFSHVGEAIIERMDSALELLQNEIEIKDGIISLKKQ